MGKTNSDLNWIGLLTLLFFLFFIQILKRQIWAAYMFYVSSLLMLNYWLRFCYYCCCFVACVRACDTDFCVEKLDDLKAIATHTTNRTTVSQCELNLARRNRFKNYRPYELWSQPFSLRLSLFYSCRSMHQFHNNFSRNESESTWMVQLLETDFCVKVMRKKCSWMDRMIRIKSSISICNDFPCIETKVSFHFEKWEFSARRVSYPNGIQSFKIEFKWFNLHLNAWRDWNAVIDFPFVT